MSTRELMHLIPRIGVVDLKRVQTESNIKEPLDKWELRMPLFLYALAGGLLSSWTVTFIKGISE